MALTKVTGELVDIGDLDISNVGSIQLDSIAGDADSNTSITFSGSDVITIATGGSGRLTIGDGALSPVTDNQIDLGTSSLEFKDAFFDGTVTADAFAGPITGDLTGTLQTAAQTNITSLGTLTALTGGTGDLVWDTTTLVVDSSANNVGIGTASPAKPLHISSADNQPLRVESTDAYSGIEIKDNGSSTLPPLISALSDDFIFYGGHGSSRPAIMFIDSSSGSVGIGTTSPAVTLDVAGNANLTADDARLLIEEADGTDITWIGDITGAGVGGCFLYNHGGTATVQLRADATAGFINNGANFGIGTASPATDLQIGDYSDAAETITIATSQNGTGRINFYDNNATEGGSIRVTGETSGSKMHFANRWSSDSDKVTFDLVNGRVGIGTASPLTPLHVVGANGLLVDTEGNGDGSVYFGGISGTDRSYIARSSDDILFWNVSDGPIRFGANNGERVRILPGGGITFNGDTASANALDDYEEGTWTPVIKGYSGSDTAALTAADPTYTRVGRLVHVSAYIHSIDFSDLGDGTYVVIDGIPFASDADNYAPIVLGYNNTNITGGYVENNGVVFLNNSAGNEYQQQNNDITPSSGSARFMISMTLNLNV